jgi:protein TonB
MKCRVLVSPEGTVEEVELVGRRDGFAELERRAVEAARRFRFTPGRREGVLVPTWTYVDVRFESP